MVEKYTGNQGKSTEVKNLTGLIKKVSTQVSDVMGRIQGVRLLLHNHDPVYYCGDLSIKVKIFRY
jgi:hypothetical protein